MSAHVGKTKSLDPRTTIEVPDDRHGLYSCDILDPDLVYDCAASLMFTSDILHSASSKIQLQLLH
jgi:hypothetical protein